MSGFKGDFLGFTYNGVHSSDLGIVRTSDGSRFNENLLPTIQDKTVQVPGGDGTYYFGSYYTQRQFSIPFAFDSLTEDQVRSLRAHFGDKKIHDLVFDEAPYKTYRAKVTGTAQIKHIVFDEGAGKERVYKGEGSIQFTCYSPYAICKKKTLSEYKNVSNVNEWAAASGLLQSLGSYDSFNSTTRSIYLYNPGDKEAHFLLKLYFKDNGGVIPAGKMVLQVEGQEQWTLEWSQMSKLSSSDTYIIFNSKLNLIEGAHSSDIKSGTVYNKFVTAGQFAPIPQGESQLVFDTGGTSLSRVNISYDYYYI